VHYPNPLGGQATVPPKTSFRDGLGGGLVAFEVDASGEEVERVMDTLRLAVPGTSLGDVETLVLCPAKSSHRTLTPEERSAAGISEGLLRVSAGLEAPLDIIADFDTALATLYTPIAVRS
jgi:cystathionine beta-lyase/cystathionine gamma-synthase